VEGGWARIGGALLSVSHVAKGRSAAFRYGVECCGVCDPSRSKGTLRSVLCHSFELELIKVNGECRSLHFGIVSINREK
jgi:hypothetical protein